MAAPSTRALVAHILRRTAFGPHPGQVDLWARKGVDATISHVLNARPLPAPSASAIAKTEDDSDLPVRWWLGRIADPSAGLHEKMTWFWHGHLTTSHAKVYRWKAEIPQHLLLREYALGNFRTLLQKITVDPAMLLYLDGSWSVWAEPNENYSRELMELFCLGLGTATKPNYSQQDVENGARALAGYGVDWETGTKAFYPDNALPDGVSVRYLGRDVHSARDVVNAVIDDPACAHWIAGRVWRFLVGTEPSAARRTALAALFKANRYNVRPLVKAILNDPAFLAGRLNRPKMPVEWVTNGMAALGLEDKDNPDLRIDTLWTLGQVPFYPPNVSGWPWGLRWLGPGLALARAAFAVESPAVKTIADATDQVSATLARCSLFEVSSQTRSAMSHAVTSPDLAGRSNRDRRAMVLLALAVGSPEFALA
jgi:uncharacterized protein (DUF1800 family)